LPATVVDIIVNSPVHETLEVAVIAADLVGALSGDGPFTVFAPTDDAFALLSEGVLDALLADPTGALANILLYHVAAGATFAGDLSDGDAIETLFNMEDVIVTIVDGNVMINDAMVIIADLEAENGVVHVINAVLLPPTNVETVNIDAISIYPNPAQNVINISGDVPAGTQYTIIDQTGRVIATNTFTGVTTIDVSGFEAGIYSFIIVGDNTLTAKQFVVN
jgi:transforming growth factor-beta-induced protein